MSDLDEMLAGHFAYQRAMDSAWRWVRRNDAREVKLSEIVARVQAKCPSADPKEIKYEVDQRLSRTRYRPPRPIKEGIDARLALPARRRWNDEPGQAGAKLEPRHGSMAWLP